MGPRSNRSAKCRRPIRNISRFEMHSRQEVITRLFTAMARAESYSNNLSELSDTLQTLREKGVS